MPDRDLAAIGRRLARATGTLDRIKEEAREAAVEAVAGGMSEVEVARLLRVNRHTVREWLGKRKR